MASRQLFLFATREDLEPGIRRIEASVPLNYSLCGLFDSPEVPRWKSVLEDEEFARMSVGKVALGNNYLILKDGIDLHVRSVPQRRSGQIKYAVDQKANPTSISFEPGGIFGNDYVMRGSIGTCSYHAASIQLLREFTRAIIDGFAKHDMYYVGHEALALHKAGARLITMSTGEKPEYDLTV